MGATMQEMMAAMRCTSPLFEIETVTGAALFTYPAESLARAVEVAVKKRAGLRRANLAGAYLKEAELKGGDLRHADLSDAVLIGANLSNADMHGAKLTKAALRGACLRGANLIEADLEGADLRGADLCGAYLAEASLKNADLGGARLHDTFLGGADLTEAKLDGVQGLDFYRQDLIAEILRLPNEIEALRDALIAGRVNGSTYSGSCACLAGTLAAACGIADYRGADIEHGGQTFRTSPTSLRERWFATIRKGHTPETSAVVKLTLLWVEEAIAIRDAIRRSAPSLKPLTDEAA